VAFSDWTEEGGYAAVDRLLEQAGTSPDAVWCDSGLQGVGSLSRFLENGGALPVHTGGDLNQMYKMALHHKLPFVAVDYPAAMGARAIEVALDVLAGKPVRRRVEMAAPVVLPRGQDTTNVRADIWAETHVRWDLPDNAILSQGPSLAKNSEGNPLRGGQDAR
jgi:DNA-binding LacI/PurR family transcriptional regulator